MELLSLTVKRFPKYHKDDVGPGELYMDASDQLFVRGMGNGVVTWVRIPNPLTKELDRAEKNYLRESLSLAKGTRLS